MRIVSLAPSNTEILYKIGAGNQLVATTSLCDYPKEAREKPSIGGWTNPKINRVREFEPDLVIASDDLQNKAVEKLEDKGLEILQVKPHTLGEVYESIERIGRRVGKGQKARKVVSEMKNELSELSLDDDPKIYCEEWMDPPMVSGNWIPGLVEEIGGKYFIEEGKRSREFELEDLKKFDPEYIFMNVCGAGPNLSPAQIKKRERWQEITAVKNQNIYVVDDALLNRPAPRLVKGAEKIVRNV